MHDRIKMALDMDIITDVILHERKQLIPHQMGDVLHFAGAEIVHTDNLMPLANERLGQMAP
jgi:hypothetical protein